MNYSVTPLGKKTIAGFHLVGPWDQTVRQGFEQLMMWVEGQQVPAREWLAVYYDNPEDVPAEKLRCATVVAVDEDYVIPANSEGVIITAIAGGDYACAARGWWITTSPPRGGSFSTACCRARRIASPPSPALRSILTTATTTATGISTCMFPSPASRRSDLPLFRTRIFTFPARSGRKSSYNWPFRFAGEGCAR